MARIHAVTRKRMVSASSGSWAATPSAKSGTVVLVRVNTIDSKSADEGRLCAGQLEQDLLDQMGWGGSEGIQSRADVPASGAWTGTCPGPAVRFGWDRCHFVTADGYDNEDGRSNLGKNQVTAEKGAVIGAGSDAAAGAPVENVLSFHLERPLRLYEVQ